MKIEGNLTGSTAETGRSQETQRADREGAARVGSSAGNTGGDRVELSSALGSLSRALATFGSDRASKVTALAAQYRAGQYKSDPEATSRAMISEALATAGAG